MAGSIAKAGDRFFEFVLVLSEAVIVLVIEKIAEARMRKDNKLIEVP